MSLTSPFSLEEDAKNYLLAQYSERTRIHDLRRTAGSYMAIQGVSLTIIGKALGHRSPQATLIYARLTQDPVRQALENAQAALVLPNNLVHISQTQKSDGNTNGAEIGETS